MLLINYSYILQAKQYLFGLICQFGFPHIPFHLIITKRNYNDSQHSQTKVDFILNNVLQIRDVLIAQPCSELLNIKTQ
jgi:hypothetical protein